MRNNNIDTLRTIATILVILVHIAGEYVISGISNSTYDFSFWIGNVVDSFSRICVPVFVLISGMFLLGRKETFGESYKKRASRLFIPLIFWSIIYMLYSIIKTFVSSYILDIEQIVFELMLGRPYYHMWYLFMLIGLYFIAPILNNNISIISRKNLWTTSVLLLIFGMVNSTYDVFLGNRPFFILWFFNYLGYFILGFLIKDYVSRISTYILIATFFISGILISLLTYITAKYFGNMYFYGYLSPLVIIASLSIFILFQQINLRKNILSRISHLTLGIYLIHAGVLDVIGLGLNELEIYIFNNPIVGIPFKFIMTFSISLLMSYLFFKSRILKKVV